MAATIAMTATDIKRVLAYSTVSQLGFMMLALGLGGWLAGMFHLFTHAFFKSLLFLCSGSVIHACGTNEMPQMGGLRRKMPFTADTMLVGCLAIAGAGIPTVDRPERLPLEGLHHRPRPLVLERTIRGLGGLFFYAALLRGGHDGLLHVPPVVHDVCRQAPRRPRLSPRPRIAAGDDRAAGDPGGAGGRRGVEHAVDEDSAWSRCCGKRSRPGIAEGIAGGLLWPALTMPAEATGRSAAEQASWPNGRRSPWRSLGFVLGHAVLRPAEAGIPRTSAARSPAMYRFLVHKWWFDELVCVPVRPAGAVRFRLGCGVSTSKGIDWLADNSARAVEAVARLDDWIDRIFVDRLVNLTGAVDLRARPAAAGDSDRQHPPIRDVDRRRHRGAVRVDESVLELCDWSRSEISRLLHDA